MADQNSFMAVLIKYVPAIFLLLVIGCKSPSDKILDDFKRVNESLDSLNAAADSRINATDSISLFLKNTASYLNIISTELGKSDPTGEKLDIAGKVLIGTSKGDSVYQFMMRVFDLGIEHSTKEEDKKSFYKFKESAKDEWLEKYFDKIPTVAAKTILSKFQNDCVNVAIFVQQTNLSK